MLGRPTVPFESEGIVPGIGLALSGSGFRAALFHAGSCWRLLELGIMSELRRVSSVSGGSIFAGVLASSWDALSRANSMEGYRRLVVEPLRKFCRLRVDAPAIGEGMLLPWKTVGDAVEARYGTDLFQTALNGIPDAPTFVFTATNLRTGRSFRFSKLYMADEFLGVIRNPVVPLAKAVAASSALPRFLSPVVIDNPGVFESADGTRPNGKAAVARRLCLSDGGLCDSLGLDTVWSRYQTVLVSDAGAPSCIGNGAEEDCVKQTLRALDAATDQARAVRKRALIDDFKRNVRSGTYWGIDTEIADYGLAEAMTCEPDVVKPLAKMSPRLDALTDVEQERLINWGYALCDAAVRTHVPQIVRTRVAAKWPCPQHPLK
jgi:NTE family protein